MNQETNRYLPDRSGRMMVKIHDINISNKKIQIEVIEKKTFQTQDRKMCPQMILG
jgi:hypothetical protein